MDTRGLDSCHVIDGVGCPTITWIHTNAPVLGSIFASYVPLISKILRDFACDREARKFTRLSVPTMFGTIQRIIPAAQSTRLCEKQAESLEMRHEPPRLQIAKKAPPFGGGYSSV
jgi:hypothetical protein